ncbi:MAG: HNH endonuclease [Pseudomonadota bacterium]|nr:HNH endonuclease [Pseudomonadota bacterium]
MIICDRRGNPIHEAIIDASDIKRVRKHRWYMHGKGYVQAQDVGLLHRFILNPGQGEFVDHISKDKLDNRKSNLRIATLSENNYNSKLHSNNTTGVTGVTYHKQSNGWVAFLEVDGVSPRKLFRERDDAIKHRQELEAAEPTFFNTPQ